MGRGPLTVALATGLAVIAAAAPARALTGEEWRRLPPAERSAYVHGVLDAWSGLAAMQESLASKDVSITVISTLVGCLRDRLMSAPAIFGIVEQYVEDHAGSRSNDMPDMIFAALTEVCRK